MQQAAAARLAAAKAKAAEARAAAEAAEAAIATAEAEAEAAALVDTEPATTEKAGDAGPPAELRAQGQPALLTNAQTSTAKHTDAQVVPVEPEVQAQPGPPTERSTTASSDVGSPAHDASVMAFDPCALLPDLSSTEVSGVALLRGTSAHSQQSRYLGTFEKAALALVTRKPWWNETNNQVFFKAVPVKLKSGEVDVAVGCELSLAYLALELSGAVSHPPTKYAGEASSS